MEVNDNNKPTLRNVLAPQESPSPGSSTWEKPTYFEDLAGKLSNHQWDLIVEYNEFQLFCMCFLEEWLVDVVIPMTKKELSKNMSLQECYVFLGCIFFMACYDGITNQDLSWSTKPVGMFDGAPFRLNAYMTRN